MVTEKSIALAGQDQYQFSVPTWANKREIAAVIATLFDVSVVEVRTAPIAGKADTFKQKSGTTAAVKKATVRLKKGQKIAEFTLPTEDTTSTANKSQDNKTAPDTSKSEPKTKSTVTVRKKETK